MKKDRWINQWTDEEGAGKNDRPAVSPVGAACAAAGRLSPLLANCHHAGSPKHPPVTQSSVCCCSQGGCVSACTHIRISADLKRRCHSLSTCPKTREQHPPTAPPQAVIISLSRSRVGVWLLASVRVCVCVHEQ